MHASWLMPCLVIRSLWTLFTTLLIALVRPGCFSEKGGEQRFTKQLAYLPRSSCSTLHMDSDSHSHGRVPLAAGSQHKPDGDLAPFSCIRTPSMRWINSSGLGCITYLSLYVWSILFSFLLSKREDPTVFFLSKSKVHRLSSEAGIVLIFVL